MDIIETGDRLVVILRRDFNLLSTRKMIRLADEAKEIHIDLTHSRIVNSEAVILLYKLIRAGKQVTLKNPPPILDEVIHILGLESVLNLEELMDH